MSAGITAADLRRLAELKEQEEAGEQSASLLARLEALEQRLDEARREEPAEVRDALELLDEEERELVLAHRASRENPEPEVEEIEPDPVVEEPRAPRQRLHALGVPRIHGGEDEPDKVEYEDADTGELRTRAGRKRGRPAVYDVEDVA